MELNILCAFTASTLAWELRPGEKRLTVCVKATFSLAHGRVAALAPAQEGAWGDAYWDNHPDASLYTPSDDVPVKPRADILLVGSAFAPGRSPIESLVARLRVDETSKALRVTGDRVWEQAHDGLRPSRAKPFVELPLRYERATVRGENKLGAQPAQGRVAAGRPLPNIDLEGDPNPYRTPGFGPLSPRSRALRSNLSEEALMWAHGVRGAPGAAPPAFDFSFFNAAPRDQQVDSVRPDAVLTLEGLSPRSGTLETRLPGLRPRVFCVEGSGAPVEVPVRCDTLWINTDREIAVLAWRGVVSGSIERATGRLLVAAEGPGNELRYEDVKKLAVERRGGRQGAAEPAPERRAPASLPQQRGDRTFVPIPGAPPVAAAAALPFSPAAARPAGAPEVDRPEPPRAPPPARPYAPIDGRSTAVPTGAPLKPALPFASDSPPSPAASHTAISVELCAGIAAEIDGAPAEAAQIFERHKVSPEAWRDARRRWAGAIDQERRRGRSAVQYAYDAAYVAQIERARGPIQVEEYARLEVAVERGDAAATLTELRLPRPALIHVQRVWFAKLLAEDGLVVKLQGAVSAARD